MLFSIPNSLKFISMKICFWTAFVLVSFTLGASGQSYLTERMSLKFISASDSSKVAIIKGEIDVIKIKSALNHIKGRQANAALDNNNINEG